MVIAWLSVPAVFVTEGFINRIKRNLHLPTPLMMVSDCDTHAHFEQSKSFVRSFLSCLENEDVLSPYPSFASPTGFRASCAKEIADGQCESRSQFVYFSHLAK